MQKAPALFIPRAAVQMRSIPSAAIIKTSGTQNSIRRPLTGYFFKAEAARVNRNGSIRIKASGHFL